MTNIGSETTPGFTCCVFPSHVKSKSEVSAEKPTYYWCRTFTDPMSILLPHQQCWIRSSWSRPLSSCRTAIRTMRECV